MISHKFLKLTGKQDKEAVTFKKKKKNTLSRQEAETNADLAQDKEKYANPKDIQYMENTLKRR